MQAIAQANSRFDQSIFKIQSGCDVAAYQENLKVFNSNVRRLELQNLKDNT